MSTGLRSTLIILDTGELLAVGSNQYGELGLNHHKFQNEFAKVTALPSNRKAIAVNIGMTYSVITLDDGQLLYTGKIHPNQDNQYTFVTLLLNSIYHHSKIFNNTKNSLMTTQEMASQLIDNSDLAPATFNNPKRCSIM